MQSDIPPLPVSCLTNNLKTVRKSNLKPKLSTCVSTSNSKPKINQTLVSLSSSGPSPYNTTRLKQSNSDKSSSKSIIGQRISSAKMLRIKQLQNQLADAHYHLNELSNENKLLKVIQKRQDSALRQYEGTNAELPRIINSHQEDLRVIQTKYKKLRSQFKETSDMLKEKESELHSLQLQNKKLLQLSKDRNLGEREKLQIQVSDLNHRINQQNETIQTLQRKLALETKYLKHQLHAEMVKHKETQKQLEETEIKLKRIEALNEKREKRSYYVSHLMFYNKDRPTVTSQSLTNLSDDMTQNIITADRFRRKSEAATRQSLPSLNVPSSLQKSESEETLQKINQEQSIRLTETYLNYEQIRHFRLQKSPTLHRAPFTTSRSSVRDSPIKESQLEDSDITKIQKNVDLENIKQFSELPKTPEKEIHFLNEDDKSKDNQLDRDENNSTLNLTNRSRSLHARLINSATEGRTNENQFSDNLQSAAKENTENIFEADKESKYDHDSVVTVIARDTLMKDNVSADTNCSNSDIESEMDIPVDCNTDEEINVKRMSDIAIDDAEIRKQSNTQSHLSKLFTQFYKPSNYSTNNDNDKVEFQTISSKDRVNSIEELSHSEIFEENINLPINNVVVQEDFNFEDDVMEKPPISIDNSLLEENENLMSGKPLDTQVLELQKLKKKLEDANRKLKKAKDSENIKTSQVKNKLTSNKFVDVNNKNSKDQKTVNENSKAFDKAKLLAAMKAIDDNENIEFLDQKSRRNSATRLQITENLYRGIPTHSKQKSDIMRELFEDTKSDNKINKEN